MAELKITPRVWDADLGTPIEFLQWRALLGRAVGLPMEIVTTDDGFSFECPKLDFNGITEENTLGYWNEMPDDPADVILYHMSDTGIIPYLMCAHIGSRLMELIQSGQIGEASYHKPLTLAYNNDITRTEHVAEGLIEAYNTAEDAEFFIVD